MDTSQQEQNSGPADQSGAGKTEYILIVACIAILVIVPVLFFGDNIRALFSTAGNDLAGRDSTPDTRTVPNQAAKTLGGLGRALGSEQDGISYGPPDSPNPTQSALSGKSPGEPGPTGLQPLQPEEPAGPAEPRMVLNLGPKTLHAPDGLLAPPSDSPSPLKKLQSAISSGLKIAGTAALDFFFPPAAADELEDLTHWQHSDQTTDCSAGMVAVDGHCVPAAKAGLTDDPAHDGIDNDGDDLIDEEDESFLAGDHPQGHYPSGHDNTIHGMKWEKYEKLSEAERNKLDETGFHFDTITGPADLYWRRDEDQLVPVPGKKKTFVAHFTRAKVTVKGADGKVKLVFLELIDESGIRYEGTIDRWGLSSDDDMSLSAVSGQSMGDRDPWDQPRITYSKAVQLVEQLVLNNKTALPKDHPLPTYRDFLIRRNALKQRATAPSDPAETIVWRAGRLTDSQIAAAQKKVDRDYRYGNVRPRKRAWLGWVNDLGEIEVAKAVIHAARPQQGIDAAFLYVMAIGEGLGLHLSDQTGFTGYQLGEGDEISGFGNLGTDTFGTAVRRLKKNGFIPKDFTEGRDYFKSSSFNEKGQEVTSANFPDLERGLVALAGMLAESRATFLRDAPKILGKDWDKGLSAKEREDQIDFWNYVYFNTGPGFPRKQLKKGAGLGFKRPWTGAGDHDNRNARYNALLRMQTLRAVEELGVFE